MHSCQVRAKTRTEWYGEPTRVWAATRRTDGGSGGHCGPVDERAAGHLGHRGGVERTVHHCHAGGNQQLLALLGLEVDVAAALVQLGQAVDDAGQGMLTGCS